MNPISCSSTSRQITMSPNDSIPASDSTASRSAGHDRGRETGLPYIPEVDGLRAVAVSAVIAFHVWPGLLPGGFAGVDVFFVISGFLVTSMLLREKLATGTLGLADFWKRRVRRLFPTGLIVLALTLVMGACFLDTAALKNLGSQAVSTLLFSANFFMWRQASDYWAPAVQTVPLLHTWSLAVEEQFYFILPLLIRFLRGRTLVAVLGSVGAISCLLSICRVFPHPAAAFYLLPGRAWELLTGALLALLLMFRQRDLERSVSRRLETACYWGGIGLIILGFVALSESSNCPALAVSVPVAGTFLVIFATLARSNVKRPVLASSGFVYAGKISYALYLWHWPILVFARVNEWPLWTLLSCIPASILTYEYIEKPTRRRASIPVLFGLFCAALLVSVSLSLNMISPFRTPPYPTPAISANFDSQKQIAHGGIHVNRDAQRDRVLVLGNSMAYQYAELINKVFSPCWITYLTVGGTPARFLDADEDGTDTTPPVVWTRESRRAFDDVRLQALMARPSVVIVSDRWNVVDPVERRRTEQFMRLLLDHAGTVIVFLDSPALDIPKTWSMQQLATRYSRPEKRRQLHELAGVAESRAAARTFFADLRAANPRLALMDPESILKKDGILPVVVGGEIVFGNHSHLSIAGTMLLEEDLRRTVRPMERQTPY